MPGFRHFAFTEFCNLDANVATLRTLCTDQPTLVRYVAWGYETCPTTQRAHLQGAIGFNRQLSLARVKAILQSNTAHIEPARRILQNYAYAVKVGKDGGEIEEYGERPVAAQGERSDSIETAIDAVKGGMKQDEFRATFFGLYRGSPSAWVELIAQFTERPTVEAHQLSPWQCSLNEKLKHAPDPREIVFVIDAIGNSGKSWFAKYYHQLHEDKCIMLQPGKRADMGYIFYKATLQAKRRVVFIDCKRSESDLLDYRFLESVKDGWMQNGKYQSTTFYFEVPHVVVLMNEHPDMSKLSSDRYSIISVDRMVTHHASSDGGTSE